MAFGALRVLVLAAAACGLSGGLRLTDDVHVGGNIMGQYMSWGALAGASLEFNVSVREPSIAQFVWVLLSNDAQFSAIQAMPTSSLCDKTNQSILANFGWGARVGGPELPPNAPVVLQLSISKSAPTASFYHFLFLSCTEFAMDFDVWLHFVNPGGEELSSGEILYKPLSLGFALCWAALAGLLLLAMAREQCVWACRRRRQRAAGGVNAASPP